MQKNWGIIIGVFVFACILLLLVLGVWWTLLAPAAPPPTPTAISVFVTPTQSAGGEVPAHGSPTLPPTIIAVTLTPPVTPAAPTATPSTTPLPTPTFINATSMPQSTSTPASPYAIVDSPNGFVNVRGGPGVEYDPPLGTYQNGVVAAILGKQYSAEGQLWWLISFPPGPYGKGWVYAPYTDAGNVEQVPWVTAPPTPTPVFVTPSATPRPYAVVNSPDGYLNVRSGPGGIYEPPLGRYNNGTTLDVLGKQLATNGALWWLVPFPSGLNGRGWIYAPYTIAKNTGNVPWVVAPPTPTLVPRTPTPTSTPPYAPIVDWTITGRVVEAATGQPVNRASVQARLGNYGPVLSTLTDSNGNFSVVGRAPDEGNLELTVNAPGYEEYIKIAGAIKPRIYNFSNIGLVTQQAPVVTWVVTGRVVEIGTYQPVADAEVKAVLGDEGVQITGFSGANGLFSIDGQARDSGPLNLTVTAGGYQVYTASYPAADSRIYNLADLALVPLAGSCAYESVISLSEATALARLQSLSFTNVATTSVVVDNGSGLIGRVINQSPNPPPEGESVRVNCQVSVVLGIGVTQ